MRGVQKVWGVCTQRGLPGGFLSRLLGKQVQPPQQCRSEGGDFPLLRLGCTSTLFRGSVPFLDIQKEADRETRRGRVHPKQLSLLRLSEPRRAHLEDFYVSGQVATCIQSPIVYYVWFGWAFLMAFVTVGSLLHSNYYFSGKLLPKPSGNTQLLDD